MEKEFNYVISNKKDLEAKGAECSQEISEALRAQSYKHSYNVFGRMQKCFESPLTPLREVEACMGREGGQLVSYGKTTEAIWITNLNSMASCVDKCKDNDSACLSNCFNTTMSKVYSDLKRFHDSLN